MVMTMMNSHPSGKAFIQETHQHLNPYSAISMNIRSCFQNIVSLGLFGEGICEFLYFGVGKVDS